MRAPDGHLGVNILREEGVERAVIPGSSIADRVLQRDTFLLLVQKDLSELEGGPCRTRKVTDTEVLFPVDGAQVEDGRPVAGHWSERWTIDRCGAPVRYIIRFVLKAFGVIDLVGPGGRPEWISRAEIEGIRALVESKLRYDPHPFLTEGAEVEVIRGPLSGTRGRLVRKDRSVRVVLSVNLIR